MRFAPALLAFAILTLAACGNSGSTLETGAAATAPGEVAIHGHLTDPGTKGPLLVFALAGSAGDPSTRETLSVAPIDSDGRFAFTTPPAEEITLVFLADGSHDGVIDGGDPVAVLTASSFSGLQGGELITLEGLVLDFRARTATAERVDVQHPGGAPASTRTPTPVPAG